MICPVCKKEFFNKSWENKSGYCSRKCRDVEYNHNYYITHKEDKKKRDKIYAEKKRKEKEEYYLAHKEEIEAEKERKKQESALRAIERRKLYWEQNKEKIRKRNKERYANDEEYRKRLREHTDRWLEKKLKEEPEYIEIIKERHKISSKKYREKNKQRLNEAQKAKYYKNLEANRKKQREYRRRKREEMIKNSRKVERH